MISAEEAYAATECRNEVEVDREMTFIKGRIADALVNGAYECYIPRRHLLDATINVLRRLNYKVKKNGMSYVISWR